MATLLTDLAPQAWLVALTACTRRSASSASTRSFQPTASYESGLTAVLLRVTSAVVVAQDGLLASAIQARSEPEKERGDSKLYKLVIGGEGGFDVDVEAMFNVLKHHEIVVIANGQIQSPAVSLDAADVPTGIQEQMVEQYHVNRLSESCENQKMKQKRMIYRARNSKSEDREAAMRSALEMKMPACDQLRSLRRTRQY